MVKRDVASQDDVIEVWETLQRVVTKDAEGFAVYAEGSNDEAVAKQCNVALSTVIGIRNRRIGRLHPERRSVDQDLLDRIAAMQKRIDDLEASGRFLKRCNDELTFRHNRLCATLTTDYRINAKHFEYQLPDAPGALPLNAAPTKMAEQLKAQAVPAR